mmetsp:Transcript_19286/g.24882  ORF Transcript_19286/g.24882 Transcript_19286/m.24882 type:complete len:541 (+) Transcript_19286:246-1868(+)|eukprot:CAMPEP_0198151576 /NCGR_PEP_ID=MMETSP1443-20131203/56147_1 /TAXON_ID=186043 /ORGANISM="Entomoneis sp., Strain CCMP2396" /LENGTH=540 /DNA_ID=CAMNT_0043817295 /DNA_START=234 /DNA_END=1856 /DNA_ORIENTATION=+
MILLLATAVLTIALSVFYVLYFIKFIDQDEQLIVDGITTKTIINGPKVFFLSFWTRKATKIKALTLASTEYCVIKNILSGEKRVEIGPQMVFLKPYDDILGGETDEGGRRKAVSLKANEFIRFVDNNTGKVRVIHGEKGCVVPGPEEVAVGGLGKMQATNLRVFEFIRVQDKQTGAVRVERGERLVFLGPFEEYLGKKQTAVEIDDETAALIRNKRTGQQKLVTEKKLFIPNEDEEVLEVRNLMKLADYEACIVRDKDGRDEFFFGKEQRSFFLQPYCSLVSLNWSRGRRRELRDLYIKKVDLRPMYMSFEFNCRTSDNVELVLEGSFFWEIVDLPGMLRFTNDTTGDICNHARSRFIELVSKRTLVQFMGEFNNIAEQVHKDDASGFYTQRGVKIHSLEVTGYHCSDTRTASVLQDIIQETTNRINRLQQQESENEVQLREIHGDIEEEKARSDLLKIQAENSRARAEMDGRAEAQRVCSFLDALSVAFPKLEMDKTIQLWQTLRKEDALRTLSEGNAQLYFTPADANISIERHTHDST